MHIVIPMSGMGSRFVKAGYEDPKPLITVDGKPIIEHVCNLFPGEDKFTFICNSKHLKETNMREVLQSIRPGSNIIEVPNHKKGPVYAVLSILDFIEDDEEVIVNYCDFGTYWDYNDFLEHTRNRDADGAIPSYRGFHPHMLGSTNYAFMRDKEQWMLEIKEKEPFTNNRMDEYASNGTYYFKKGSYVKKYFKKLVERDINLNGEYYVSLVYNLLVEDKLKVSIYEIQHMLQWGTPEDLERYNVWSRYFHDIITFEYKGLPKENSVTVLPLAGRGSRFVKEGYLVPKPLLEISGKPMIIQAAASLPKTEKQLFVVLDEHDKQYSIKKILKKNFDKCEIIDIEEVTKGQAITCSLALEDLDKNSSLIIGATDNAMIYDETQYEELINDPKVDGIIFTFRNHISSKVNPHMYGWVETDGTKATGVSVKKPISDNPIADHAIVGAFYFRTVELFENALDSLLATKVQVNGEYYVDSLMGILIESGHNIRVLEVDHYVCWGTPSDYETFVYWQSFFSKVNWHRYSLEQDYTIDSESVNRLKNEYKYVGQTYF